MRVSPLCPWAVMCSCVNSCGGVRSNGLPFLDTHMLPHYRRHALTSTCSSMRVRPHPTAPTPTSILAYCCRKRHKLTLCWELGLPTAAPHLAFIVRAGTWCL